MTREDLYDAITNVRDDLVAEAEESTPSRKPVNWRRWGGIAAAAALVIGAGGWWAVKNLGGKSALGGSGHEDGSSAFMSYAGPVFPLTALEGNQGLSVERALTYDFSLWNKTWWSNEDEVNSRVGLTAEQRQEVLERYNELYPEGGMYRSSTDLLVTDSYTLKNSTGEDKTVTLLYPFVSSLQELYQDSPILTADGTTLNTSLHAGGYSGGFQGALGGPDQETGNCNLKQFESWEDYKSLLSDGRYLNTALGAYPDLSGIPVVVYHFTDAWGEPKDNKAGRPNPSIRVYFDLDYNKTQVLTTGFHAGLYDRENGRMGKGFSIPQPGERDHDGATWNLIVIGEDIANLRTEGRATGGWDQDPLIEAGVTVQRYETDLDTALRTLYLDELWAEQERQPGLTQEMFRGLCYDQLLTYGLLSGEPIERYNDGMLDNEFTHIDRVFYLETEVTIPAGESVKVEATLTKKASYDFYCAHTENQEIYGYDMVTRLGSTLDFTIQTAKAVNTDKVEILRQNYGFDWEKGVYQVDLDPGVEHYYMEVRRIKTEK